MDRLAKAIERTGNPSVVGLDPTPGVVPEQVMEEAEGDNDITRLSHAFVAFNRAIIDAVADVVPAVKPQIAMYETLGAPGIDAYCQTTAYAQDRGLYVLGDIKRGDIGSTATAYASHLAGLPIPGIGSSMGRRGPIDVWHEDAVTVNAYLGLDGVAPFLAAAKGADKDVFVLVRTSNPSGGQVQNLRVEDGLTVAEHMALLVEKWGEDTVGESGYSRVGAVVGATHPQEGAALRERLPHTFLLIPGYGAQGGTADGVAAMFDGRGGGAIVNSSRGIIGAWRGDPEYSHSLPSGKALEIVARDARRAAEAMRDDINGALERSGRRGPASQEGGTAA